MANLDPSAVTVLGSHFEGGLINKDYVSKRVSMVLASQGIVTANSQIPAAAFGLAIIRKGGVFVQSDNSKIILGAPSADGSLLLTYAFAAVGGAPVAQTGTFVGEVVGPPLATY